VGHTLGLRHNHRASSAYSIEQLRSPEFTATHGTVASIMAYGRFNYVAQPEDKVKQLIPIVGPYDFFAIEWGYKPITAAKTSDEEKATLDKWAARQMDEPWLRFGGEDGPAAVDPTVKTENIGSDTVKATELGLKNIDKVVDFLVSATTEKGEDFKLLQEVYGAIMTHRRNWFNAIALNIGGVVEHRTLGGRGTETFARVSKKQQKEAVDFLIANAFVTPTKLLQPGIVNRFKYSGVASDISSQQAALLQNMLSTNRVRRLMDAEIMSGSEAYSAIDLVSDVQNGVWSEIANGSVPKIDPLRRALQRAYLDHMKTQVTPPASSSGSSFPFDLGDLGSGSGSTDYRAVARVALLELQKKIDAALTKTTDAMTRAHLLDSAKEIENMLAGPKK
jgi:Met-zincin